MQVLDSRVCIDEAYRPCFRMEENRRLGNHGGVDSLGKIPRSEWMSMAAGSFCRAFEFGVVMELLVLLVGRVVPFVPLCGQFLRSVHGNMAAKRLKKHKNDGPI